MPSSPLDDFKLTQRDRINYIDVKTNFLGTITRKEIIAKFKIATAAATRDITQYRKKRPYNLNYDTSTKKYLKSNSFDPISNIPEEEISSLFYRYFSEPPKKIDEKDEENPTFIPIEYPATPTPFQPDKLIPVTHAIHQKRILEIKYHSIKNGVTIRKIIPFALVNSGLRWHTRAYDQKNKRFADFVINRIESSKLLGNDIPKDQTAESDEQWQKKITLHIVPHPRLGNKSSKTIAMEHSMQPTASSDAEGYTQYGIMKKTVRAALVGYFLRLWNVDCSPEHTLTDNLFQLWLYNNDVLKNVKPKLFAPGYTNK